jgi:large subunit ribosomal protein L14
MIQKGTYIRVCDNSGIRFVKCIKIFGTSNPRYASLGGIVLVAVSNKDVIRGFSNTNIKYGLITNINKFFKRRNGEFIKFDENTCLVINKNYSFPSTRVYNPIAYEVRNHEISNLSLYAEAVI